MAEGGQHECMVLLCRDTKSHTTNGHRCGSCDQYGHGEFECAKTIHLQKLRELDFHRLPEHMHCDIDGCKYPWSHTRVAHLCSKCGNNHSSKKCYIQEIEYFMGKYSNFIGCGALNDFDYHNFFRSNYVAQSNCFINVRITEYISLYFIKTIDGIKGLEVPSRTSYDNIDSLRTLTYGCNDITNEYMNVLNGLEPTELLSNYWMEPPDMNSMNEYQLPSQDQLSPEEIMDMILDDEYHLPDETFTNYTSEVIDNLDILKLDTKKCPLCRMVNNTNKCFEMKGSGDMCTICLDKNVQIFFSECGHSVACKSCFNNLD